MTTPPSSHGPEQVALLDAYLDDLLAPRERAEFENRLAAESDLAEAVAFQRRLDESLARYAAPPDGTYPVGPHRTMAEAYRHTVEEGFTSKWVCRDDREFALVFLDQFGDMLSMNFPLPTGVEALGLKYFDAISPRTISMLARVEGEPVMVFVDRLERDHDTVRDVPPGLTLHRRELGALVLYEITPHEEPTVIFHLQRPETLPEGGAPDGPGQ